MKVRNNEITDSVGGIKICGVDEKNTLSVEIDGAKNVRIENISFADITLRNVKKSIVAGNSNHIRLL